MIMAIAIIYIFFILCDISSLVENYFQKILSPPQKFQFPLFTHSPPKCRSPPFCSAPLLQKGVGRTLCLYKIRVLQTFLNGICKIMRTTCGQNLLNLFSAESDTAW